MIKVKKIPILFLMTLLFSSCSFSNPSSSSFEPGDSSNQDSPSSAKDAEDDYQDNNKEFSVTSSIGKGYEIKDKTYTILEAGEYTFKGKLEEGQIVVNAENKEVVIRLEGVTMSSNKDSLIKVEAAEKVTIKAIEGTYNELKDQRDTFIDDEASILSSSDLDIGGSGSLFITSLHNIGIHSKKDMDVKKLTLKVDAYSNALKGKDSVEIESGNLVLISRASNGIKTSNSNITSKGNQKGNIAISGGNIEVYSANDAFDAAYNFLLENVENPQVKLFTDKYSSYSSDTSEIDKNVMYLRVSGRSLSNEYRYAACFYNSDEDYVWKDAAYYKTVTGNRGNSYFIYRLEVPTGYTNIQWYRFLSSQSTNSFENYEAKTEGGTINTNKDMYTISRDANKTMSGSWTTYEQSLQGGGSSNKSDQSAKGIKAANEIIISGGQLTIKANDDGLHAQAGAILENGSTGTGIINISGSVINIISTDDGIHADTKATFEGNCNIIIQEAYEGIEAQQLYVKGGKIEVNASDDGVNASAGDLTTLIEVSGGYLDVSVGTGDTDAIDSNGSYTQTGGFVIARCGNNDQSGNMAALDADGQFLMSGGTFIAAGSLGVSLNNSEVNSVQFGASSSGPGGGGPGGWWAYSESYSFTKGNYTISDTNIAFSLNQTYSRLTICSDELLLNHSYTITNGSASYEWSQDSAHKTLN